MIGIVSILMCLSTYICWLTKIEQKDNKQFVHINIINEITGR